jgi:hypothetical protein
MEFLKPGTYIDFMKYRGPVITVLGLMAALSLVSPRFNWPSTATPRQVRSARPSKMRATRAQT